MILSYPADSFCNEEEEKGEERYHKGMSKEEHDTGGNHAENEKPKGLIYLCHKEHDDRPADKRVGSRVDKIQNRNDTHHPHGKHSDKVNHGKNTDGHQVFNGQFISIHKANLLL